MLHVKNILHVKYTLHVKNMLHFFSTIIPHPKKFSKKINEILHTQKFTKCEQKC